MISASILQEWQYIIHDNWCILLLDSLPELTLMEETNCVVASYGVISFRLMCTPWITGFSNKMVSNSLLWEISYNELLNLEMLRDMSFPRPIWISLNSPQCDINQNHRLGIANWLQAMCDKGFDVEEWYKMQINIFSFFITFSTYRFNSFCWHSGQHLLFW